MTSLKGRVTEDFHFMADLEDGQKIVALYRSGMQEGREPEPVDLTGINVGVRLSIECEHFDGNSAWGVSEVNIDEH
jgi:hypothetical protein